jgi:hypothetical protein
MTVILNDQLGRKRLPCVNVTHARAFVSCKLSRISKTCKTGTVLTEFSAGCGGVRNGIRGVKMAGLLREI